VLGDIPTSSVKRLLKVPSDEQPTLEADLGDAEVAATQQRHRALDAPCHEVAVRRLAEGEPELAAEVPGRHVRVAGERLNVQRLGVLPIDPVTNAAQSREVAQVLGRGGSADHCEIMPRRTRDAGVPPHSTFPLARSASLAPSAATSKAERRWCVDVWRV
jgi:hypothetical protein